jgi:GNAT superfamily N-acetyltransferase
MYKLVDNAEEEQIFNEIWTEAWQEKGFELEFTSQVLGRYLVYNEGAKPIATVELKPYFPGESDLDKWVPFAQHPAIISAQGKIAEVDKVAIHKDHRGKNLSRLLATLVLLAEQNGIQEYVALLEPVLFRILEVKYHVPLSRVGEKLFYKGDDVIPVIIHAEEFFNNKQQYDWFLSTTNKQQYITANM